MYALVQFLVDKVKAIVPIKDIKDFDSEEFDTDFFRPYEVFWKSPNGEGGTGYWYAVVLLVAETKELVEQRKKTVKLPSTKRLEVLLKECSYHGENRHKAKEKIFTCEKDKFRGILMQKLKQKRNLHSQSSYAGSEKGQTSHPKGKRLLHSASESSEGGDSILKSKLIKKNAGYEKVLRKLKLKQEENARLKKRNNRLEELNLRLQTQLLYFISANVSLRQNLPSSSATCNSSPKKRVQIDEEGLRQCLPSATSDSVPKEMQIDEVSLEQNLPSVSATCVSKEKIQIDEEGNSSPKTNSNFYLHNNGDLMKWNDEQMELVPGVVIRKDQWLKIISAKNMNESRLIRNLAVFLWGNKTLQERSVTGIVCRRFQKNGVAAKPPLTPVKIDAVQNGLRFWLKEHLKKEEKEAIKLSSTRIVRKLLSDKIMDLVKRNKKILSQSLECERERPESSERRHSRSTSRDRRHRTSRSRSRERHAAERHEHEQSRDRTHSDHNLTSDPDSMSEGSLTADRNGSPASKAPQEGRHRTSRDRDHKRRRRRSQDRKRRDCDRERRKEKDCENEKGVSMNTAEPIILPIEIKEEPMDPDQNLFLFLDDIGFNHLQGV